MRHWSIWISSLYTALLFCISTMGSAAADPTISGTVGRGASTSFQITVTVTGIDSTKIDLLAKETDLTKDRIAIFLPTKNSSTSVPYDAATDAVNMPFYATSVSLTKKDTGSGTYTFIYSIKISELAGSGELKKLRVSGSNAIKVYAQYYENKEQITKNTTATDLTVNPSIAKAAVLDFKPVAIALGVKANWTNATSVDFISANGTVAAGTIEGVALVAIANTTGSTNLPALTFNPDPTATSDSAAPSGTCSYNSGFNDGDQCITCDNATSNNYLNIDTLSNMNDSGIYAQVSTETGNSSLSLTHLEANKTYSVFMVNQPGGLNQTACYRITPYEGKTYGQQNGEDKTYQNPRCFVATAAYGSPLHRNLKLFTWFREHVLLKHSWGKAFVHWYNIYGPPAAKVIAEHPALALGVRTVLWVPAIGISAWLGLVNHDPLAIAGVTAVFLLAALMIFKRRRIVFVENNY